MTELATLLALIDQRDALTCRIREQASTFSWQVLADAGLRCEAIIRYREQHGIGLLASKSVVDTYMGIAQAYADAKAANAA